MHRRRSAAVAKARASFETLAEVMLLLESRSENLAGHWDRVAARSRRATSWLEGRAPLASAFVDDLYVRYARCIQPVPTVDVEILLSRVDALLERLAVLVESGVERRLPARVFVGAERREATLTREGGKWLVTLDGGPRCAVHFDAVSLSGRHPMDLAGDDGDLDGPDFFDDE